MHWLVLTENDAATATIKKTPFGRSRTHELLLPKLLSGALRMPEIWWRGMSSGNMADRQNLEKLLGMEGGYLC
jgi:hypothetical protein